MGGSRFTEAITHSLPIKNETKKEYITKRLILNTLKKCIINIILRFGHILQNIKLSKIFNCIIFMTFINIDPRHPALDAGSTTYGFLPSQEWREKDAGMAQKINQ
jgi:hypothetical protein